MSSEKVDFINELESIARQALIRGQFVHALKAYEMIAKVRGLFESKTKDKSQIEAEVKMYELDEKELNKLVSCLQKAG